MIFFIRKFLCVILSVLILFQSSPSTAYAEGNNSAGQTQTVKFQEQEGLIVGEIVSTLIVWAAALVSMMVIHNCLKEGGACGMGALAGGAAGAAVLVGEIMAIVNFQKSVDEIQINMRLLRKYKEKCEQGVIPDPSETNGVNPCDQLESVRAQKKSLESMKSALETKGALYITAAAAYLVAAAIELFGGGQETTNLSNLVQALTTCQTNSSTQAVTYAAQRQPDAATACTACSTACGTASGLATELMVDLATPSTESASQLDCATARQRLLAIHTAFDRPCDTGTAMNCNTHSMSARVQHHQRSLEYNACTGPTCALGCTNPPTVEEGAAGSNFQKFEDDFFKQYDRKYFSSLIKDQMSVALRTMIQSAQAQENNGAGNDTRGDVGGANLANITSFVLKAAGALVFVLLGLTQTWGDLVDKLFATHVERTIVYTVMSALVGAMALVIYYGLIPIVERNIEKLANILGIASTIVTAGKITTGGVDSLAGFAYNFDLKNTPDISPGANQPFPCAFGGDGKGNCLDGREAQEFTLQRLNLGDMAGVSTNLRNFERSISGQRRISQAGLESARDLARAHSKLKKQLNLLKKAFNDKQVAKGMAPVDFEGQEKSLISAINSKALDLVNKQGGDKILASAAGNFPATSQEQLDKKLSGEEKLNLDGKVDLAQFKEETGGLNFTLEADEKTEGLEIQPEQDFSKSTVKDEGIVDNKNASLFEVISLRYLKSAFSRLFNEEK